MNDEQLKTIGSKALEREKRGRAYGIANAEYKKTVDALLDSQASETAKKIEYYSKRINDKTLDKRQRSYAKLRLNQLRRNT